MDVDVVLAVLVHTKDNNCNGALKLGSFHPLLSESTLYGSAIMMGT